MKALQLMTNRMADARPKKYLHKEVAEDLDRGHQRRHCRIVAGGLEQLQQGIERILVEGRDHRLGDVGKEMIDAEARAGKRIHPIVLKQAANDKPQQKVGQIARPHRMRVEPECHAAGIPVDDHADQREERDAAQLRKSKLRQRPTVLRREVGQIVGELI